MIITDHIPVNDLPYCKTVREWLSDMWLIDKVFRRSGNRDRKDIEKYPAGFINVDEPYDKIHHAARYHFTQCPNAEFARSHGLLHVLPLMRHVSRSYGTSLKLTYINAGSSSV